jgi:uncharacterized protein YjbJ (UPF0337 family)
MSDLKRESMEQQAKGTGSDVKGKVKEAAGSLAGRDDWKAEGEADQAEGSIRKGAGKAGSKISDAVDKLKGD